MTEKVEKNEAIRALLLSLADADQLLKGTIAHRDSAAAELVKWEENVALRIKERDELAEAIEVLRKRQEQRHSRSIETSWCDR